MRVVRMVGDEVRCVRSLSVSWICGGRYRAVGHDRDFVEGGYDASAKGRRSQLMSVCVRGVCHPGNDCCPFERVSAKVPVWLRRWRVICLLRNFKFMF